MLRCRTVLSRSRCFFLLLVAGLIGALGFGGPGKALAQGKNPDELTIAIPGYENNLTPFTISFLSAPNAHDILTLVYDTLFWSQNDKTPDAWLAESATPSPDAKQWTLKLRTGKKWHDGVAFSAEDVKFSFDYYKQFLGASGRYAHHAADTPPYDRAEVLDAQTVKLFFKAPAPSFPILPGGDLPIIPKHIWESVKEPTKYTGLPIGTGPYKMVEAVTDQGYKLEANQDYFKGKVMVKTLNLVVVREPTVAFAALRNREVDHVARNLPAELVSSMKGTKGIKLIKGTRNESVQLFFNARKAPFDDPKVRKAISLAIDNQSIVDNILLGLGTAGNDNFLHPDSPWALPGASHEKDLVKSRKLLEEAGFEIKGNTRVNAKGLKVDLEMLVNTFEPQQLRAAQFIVSQLQVVGIKATVEPIDPATLRTRRTVLPGKVPDFDSYLSILESHAHVDPDGLYYFFHSPGNRGFGTSIAGYSNPKFDQIAEDATVETDLPTREKQLFELQKILIAEQPVITLYYPDGLFAVRDTYNGWYSDPGHGILTKRSFIEGQNKAKAPVATSTPSTAAASTPPPPPPPSTAAATIAPKTTVAAKVTKSKLKATRAPKKAKK